MHNSLNNNNNNFMCCWIGMDGVWDRGGQWVGRALRTDSRKKKPSFRNQLTTIIVVKSHTHIHKITDSDGSW